MSQANHLPQRVQHRDNLITISVLYSLWIVGALSVGIWALISVTILGS